MTLEAARNYCRLFDSEILMLDSMRIFQSLQNIFQIDENIENLIWVEIPAAIQFSNFRPEVDSDAKVYCLSSNWPYLVQKCLSEVNQGKSRKMSIKKLFYYNNSHAGAVRNRLRWRMVSVKTI